MNRKILLSSTVVLGIVAIVATYTGAVFNDTETSTGNVFTAGSVDLTVDHTLATYNDFVCQNGAWVEGEAAVWETVWQIGDEEAPADHPYDEFNYAGVPGSGGLSEDYDDPFVVGSSPDSEFPWNSNAAQNYATDFDIEFTYSDPIPVTARLIIGWAPGASGTETKVVLDYDDTQIGSIVRNGSTNNAYWENYERFEDVVPFSITQGTHTLTMLQTTGNGTLWDYVRLEILPGSVGTCNLFEAQDLDGSPFFTFGDIKPGDHGTNVVSLHVETNDAYACLLVDGQSDEENVIIEPEDEAGDTSDPEGELSGYIEVFTWEDDGDGIYEPDTVLELTTAQGPDLIDTELLSMSLNGGGPTGYVGLAWCVGDMTVWPSGAITCDGSTVGNDSQTDSFTANLVAYAEQQRNNDGFSCSNVDLGPAPTPTDN